jgi:error-prone DNA polymerase
MITPFLKARHGWAAAKLIHPRLHDILAETEGVVVFHEQVIRIIAEMTGISLAQADEKRRALGSRDSQQEVCDWFFPAATEAGFDLPVITEVWEVLRAFGSFGFCKAHAAAFALPTYQSAWLKTHYPAAFLAGVLTHDPGMYPKRLILDEVRQLGLTIAPLDINYSDRVYRVEDNGSAIRISLSTVAGISDREIESIIAARPYVDLADFFRRSGAAMPTIESLILTGAFDAIHNLDSTELNRRDLLLHLSDLKQGPVQAISGSQLTFGFTPPVLIPSGLPELGENEKVQHEVERLGMDVTHHMVEFYGEFLNAIGAVRSCELLKQRSRTPILVAGVKVMLQTPPIRSGKRVIFLTLDDGYGCSDATFFPDAQTDYAGTLYNSQLLLVRGEVRRTGARGVSLRADAAWSLSDVYNQWLSNKVAI